MSTECLLNSPKSIAPLDIYVDIWYNKCKKNRENQAKSLHMEGTSMYRYSNGQISLSDFHQPMGMQLKEDNRWVKKAQMGH